MESVLPSKISFLTKGLTTIAHSANEFLQMLTGKPVTENEIVLSFDMISLFTSIPQQLAENTVSQLLGLNEN